MTARERDSASRTYINGHSLINIRLKHPLFKFTHTHIMVIFRLWYLLAFFDLVVTSSPSPVQVTWSVLARTVYEAER